VIAIDLPWSEGRRKDTEKSKEHTKNILPSVTNNILRC
jgi:hypothetical protein